MGHLPREESQVLAPRLDHDRISMFGIVRDSSIVARGVPAVENAWRSGIAIDVIITSKLPKQVRQLVCSRMETACKSLALYRDTELEDSMRMKLLELLQVLLLYDGKGLYTVCCFVQSGDWYHLYTRSMMHMHR